jgi:hypothetical protein
MIRRAIPFNGANGRIVAHDPLEDADQAFAEAHAGPGRVAIFLGEAT